jgi:Flp pilus assembly protein TadG
MKVPMRLRLQRIVETDGVAAVEFAIILSVFLMMLLGVIEFGYDWYLKHALTNASRDGARYGVMYKTNSATNLQIYPKSLPSGTWSTIATVVKNELNAELPSTIASTVQVTCSGAAWTSASPNPGDPLTVTVTATKDWCALGALIPSLKNMTVSVQTTMNLE